MRAIRSKLSRQFVSIVVIILGLVIISLGVFLPKTLEPVYENSLYNYLRQPLEFIEEDINNDQVDTEVAYIYSFDGKYSISENFNDIAHFNTPRDFIGSLKGDYGKIFYDGRLYYYYQQSHEGIVKVAFTNSNYLIRMRDSILKKMSPLLLITFVGAGLIIGLWSYLVVRKIEKLTQKIDHIENDDYDHSMTMFDTEDEIRTLAYAIEDMRISLKNEAEYRNQMYQNISHDFKTPLTVIKSYVEAVEDGVENSEDAFQIIKEQTNKLEQKVHSLLYLNKLDYIKDLKQLKLDKIDITKVLNESVKKFRFHRKDVKFHLQIDKDYTFLGTYDLWETVVDNILGNFVRYADKEIKITVKQNQIIFYNDGPNIDNDLLKVLFVPYRKGIKGEFGLGLSIIKKSLKLIGYDIEVKNNKKGVSFIVKKGGHR